MLYPKPGKRKKQNRFTGGIEKKAWDEVSLHVKLLHSCDNGYIQCVTCKKTVNWAGSNPEIHAGHFYNWGNYPQLRFEILNIWPQCRCCNCNPEKSRGNFGLFIARTLSEDELIQLEWLSSYKFKKEPSKEGLELIYQEYKEKNRIILKEKMF